MSRVVEYYNQFDEWGRLEREPLEFFVNFHHITSLLPSKGRILDNGAGPGKYSIALAELGYDVSLSDLTPKLVEMAKQKAIEKGVANRFSGFHVMDARNLSEFAEEHFDASLMLGPMYHLQAEEDCRLAVKELYRVTKKDGVVFVAFMSRTRLLTTSLLHPESWKPNHTYEGLSQFIATGEFNHSDVGRFTGAYYFNIEDIQAFMESHGFEMIKLIGSSSIAGSMNQEQWDYWRQQGDKTLDEIKKVVLKESENPYVLGFSSHLLFVGKRV